jgi:hypothetical protein
MKRAFLFASVFLFNLAQAQDGQGIEKTYEIQITKEMVSRCLGNAKAGPQEDFSCYLKGVFPGVMAKHTIIDIKSKSTPVQRSLSSSPIDIIMIPHCGDDGINLQFTQGQYEGRVRNFLGDLNEQVIIPTGLEDIKFGHVSLPFINSTNGGWFGYYKASMPFMLTALVENGRASLPHAWKFYASYPAILSMINETSDQPSQNQKLAKKVYKKYFNLNIDLLKKDFVKMYTENASIKCTLTYIPHIEVIKNNSRNHAPNKGSSNSENSGNGSATINN